MSEEANFGLNISNRSGTLENAKYKIPALSNTNPPLTTGLLATPNNGGIKTIYDPTIWTDVKLDIAIKEAVIDFAKKNGQFLDNRPLIGKTSEGYEIEFYVVGNQIQTFYFFWA